MSVTDLTGTSWKFHNYPSFTVGTSFDLNFVDGTHSTQYVRLYVETLAMAPALKGAKAGGGVVNMYMAAYYSWYASTQYINITGGEDATNPDCIAWLEQFADPYIDVYKSYTAAFANTADAIRTKTGSADKIQWDSNSGFADAVNSIYLGTDTRDGTANKWDIAEGVIAYSNAERLVGTMEDAEGVSF